MELTVDQLPDDLAQVKRIAVGLAAEAILSASENRILREELRLLRAQLFGKSSEYLKGPDGQLLLFITIAPDGTASVQKPIPQIDVPTHKRAKPGRRPLPDYLPRKPVIHDVSEAEKQCGCGAQKCRIGEEVSEEIEYNPASLFVLRHIRPKYACAECEGVEDPSSPTVAIAPAPPRIIPKGIAGPGLLAHVMTAKFADAIPFYRQERQFARLGVDIGRASMSNWAIALGKACAPLLELLRLETLCGPVVNCDETTLQVLDEPGRKATTDSFLWVFAGGAPGKPAIVFVYSPTRSGSVAAEYLKGYQGGVQADAYSGYDFLEKVPGIILYGCWAHARRKFTDVIKAAGGPRPVDPLNGGVADEIVERLRLMYAVDASARERQLSAEETAALRQEFAGPQLDEIKKRLDVAVDQVPPKSLLGKAVSYARGQMPRLERYLENGHVRPDNNRAENAIRPFVVGRKNWLFAGTPEGARANATLYSLIETAKANGLEPCGYLLFVFERLPYATTADELKALLPQYLDRGALDRSP